ncbi:hypothetical protein [Streptomyces axinellae]|uniref:Secreted protein n=1 Tax=Streptomyces axinellae TaxID=552788 RepID=A0ABP6C2R1_9ACTN
MTGGGETAENGDDSGTQDAEGAPGRLSRFPRLSRLSRRRKGAAALLCLVVLGAASLGTWATGTWPFDKESYCWGAWREDSGPVALSDRVMGDGYERVGEETAAPAPSPARATCSVRVVESTGQGTSSVPAEVSRITAEVGPVPRGAAERRSWLADFFDAKAAPLPEGLPGFAGGGGGALVLPKACDRNGRPTAVTVRGLRGTTSVVGSEPDVAQLLLAVANTAAGKAGCAGGRPMRITAPVADSDTHDLSGAGKSTCRIPGFDFTERENDRYRAHVGAVEDGVQTCSVDDETDVSAPGFAGQFVMARQPRLVALLTGSTGDGSAGDRPPGKGWRGKGKITGRGGILRAECGGAPTVFYMNLGDGLRGIARPGTREIFARAANSVAGRLGCEAVAPRS